MKFWTDIREWIAEEDAIIAAGKDSITFFTGEEGEGKSYAMLAKNVLSDPSFFRPGSWSPGWRPALDTDRVLFDEDDFKRQAVKIAALGPGRAVQLDEVDAHRRGSNTRKRRGLLKFLKERRALRLRVTVGYPHVDQLDRDILRSRVRYRAHKQGNLLEIKQRVVLRETQDRKGNPIKVIDWVKRGRFPIPDISGFQLTAAYDLKKNDFTTRVDEDLEEVEEFDVDFQPRRIDLEAAMPVVERIKAAIAKPNAGVGKPANEVFLDQVLADLKSAP